MTYRVPTLAEIAQVKGTNGYKVISTFAGAGGSSTGYEMAGFQVCAAVEFNDAARATYWANHPGTTLVAKDIRQVTGRELLDVTGIENLDVFDGSPPCESFSTAGVREKAWGVVREYSDSGHWQRADDLFFEYVRLVGELRPKVFVAENVAGLLHGKAVGYARRVMAQLRDHGYQVQAKLLDARWLGVPQSRRRAIFIGVRDDLGLQPVFPKPFPAEVSMREAFDWPEGWWLSSRRNWTTASLDIETLDQPAATVTARTDAETVIGLDPGHLVLRDMSKRPSDEGFFIRGTEEPSPSVLGSGGVYGRGTVYGVVGPDPAHFITRRYDSNGSSEVLGSLDESPPIVATHGTGGSAIHQTGVIGPDPGHVGRMRWLGSGRHELGIDSLDEPSATILGSGGAGAGSYGLDGYVVVGPEPTQEAPEAPVDPETGKSLSLHGKRVGRAWEKLRDEGGLQRFTHLPPDAYPRRFTLGELRAICSFPPDYVLTGSYEQRWERCGQAVPPLMMKAIADTIRREVLDRVASS